MIPKILLEVIPTKHPFSKYEKVQYTMHYPLQVQLFVYIIYL